MSPCNPRLPLATFEIVQAEILLAQLRQYEGLEPEALVRVVHPEAVAT